MQPNDPKYKKALINCKYCGKPKRVFEADIKRGKAKYCSRECVNKSQIKIVSLTCAGCGKQFTRHSYKVNKNTQNWCTQKCFRINSDFYDSTRGEKNRLWKGGNGKEWRKLTPEYRKWRKGILEAQGEMCKYCGSTERLEVDHLWPYKVWPKLATDPRNGQVLCHECHKKTFTHGIKNHLFLLKLKQYLGDNPIEKGAPAPEEIMQARRQVKIDLGI